MSDFSYFIGYLYDSVVELFKLFLGTIDYIDWINIGVKTKDDKIPLLVNNIATKSGNQFVYHLPVGLSISDIIAKKDKIESNLKSKVSIELADNFNVVITECNAHYEKAYKLDLSRVQAAGMKFFAGVDLNGNEIMLDLGGNELHTGVFGSTGSGKSVFLNLLMTQFVLKNIETRVIDLKGGVEFAMYRKYNRMSYFAITEDEAENVLAKTVELMDRRYKTLLEKGCKSYKDCKGMTPIVLLIDEYNALIDNKTCKKLLFALLSRARAANIICIISTQRPSHEVLPGILKCNLKNFVTFRTENETDSEIVLSQKGNYRAFTDLKSSGEGLLKVNGSIRPFKAYYLDDKAISESIKPNLTKHEPIRPITTKTQKATREDVNRIDDLI